MALLLVTVCLINSFLSGFLLVKVSHLSARVQRSSKPLPRAALRDVDEGEDA